MYMNTHTNIYKLICPSSIYLFLFQISSQMRNNFLANALSQFRIQKRHSSELWGKRRSMSSEPQINCLCSFVIGEVIRKMLINHHFQEILFLFLTYINSRLLEIQPERVHFYHPAATSSSLALKGLKDHREAIALQHELTMALKIIYTIQSSLGARLFCAIRLYYFLFLFLPSFSLFFFTDERIKAQRD